MSHADFKPSFFATAEKASDGLDLTGRVGIVTGATSGIGVETARVLALRGMRVYLGCRNVAKAEKVIADLVGKKEALRGRLFPLKMDLLEFASVKAAADEFSGKENALHALVLNAGIMHTPLHRQSDGYESQLAADHLGHFALTHHLFPLLRKTEDSRVVAVASSLHAAAARDFPANLNFEPDSTYDKFKAYGNAKLSNVLFARELNRRFSKDVVAVSCHPGVIRTGLVASYPSMIRTLYAALPTIPYVLKTIPQGAATSVFCAVSPNAQPGSFHVDCAPTTPSKQGQSDELAAELWKKSLEMCKIATFGGE